ncbi:TetR/AcrR family transcriptional regulator [Streptomyces massasporeus]
MRSETAEPSPAASAGATTAAAQHRATAAATSHTWRDRVAAAADRARLDDGPAPEALERLCLEYFELGDRLLLLYDVPQFVAWSGIEEESAADLALLALIRRGQKDGTLDPEVDVSWLQDVLWALLYAAWMQARDQCIPKHTALSLCLRTLRKAVAP